VRSFVKKLGVKEDDKDVTFSNMLACDKQLGVIF